MARTSFRFAAGIAVATLLVVALSGCKSPGAPSGGRGGGAAPGGGGSADPVARQGETGADLYARSCAACHGAAGQGTEKGPPVIGPGALPTFPPMNRRMRRDTFQSAKDIGMFIKDNMPPGRNTPPDQTAAILTFLLKANGVTPPAPMDPSVAASIPWRR